MVEDKARLKSVELRVEASVVLRRLSPTLRNARAAQVRTAPSWPGS
jgi:hypothetical protein